MIKIKNYVHFLLIKTPMTQSFTSFRMSTLGLGVKVFFRVLVFFFLCSAISLGYASESECSKLSSTVDNAEKNYRPPLEAKVIGNSRLYFHSAPKSKCQVKGVFVIKGDSLTVYKSYGHWANVMFISKDGEDFIGWVQEDKIKIIGQYGRNP